MRLTNNQIAALRTLDKFGLVRALAIDGRTRAALLRKELVEPTRYDCLRLTTTGARLLRVLG